jgi:hypothetical protein
MSLALTQHLYQLSFLGPEDVRPVELCLCGCLARYPHLRKIPLREGLKNRDFLNEPIGGLFALLTGIGEDTTISRTVQLAGRTGCGDLLNEALEVYGQFEAALASDEQLAGRTPRATEIVQNAVQFLLMVAGAHWQGAT